MKKILLTGIMGVLLLSGLMIIVPGLLNLNHYKDTISRKVKDYTGRTLTIKGDIRLSFLPTLTLKAETITFSNSPDFSSTDMVRIPELEVSVPLLPLLRGKLMIDDLTLKNPVFFLEKDAKGVPNWQIPIVNKPQEKVIVPGEEVPSHLAHLSINHIAVTSATIRYKEGANTLVMNDLSVKAALNKVSGKVEATFRFDQEGKQLEAEAEIADAFALLSGKATACKVEGSYGEQHFSLVVDNLLFKDKLLQLPSVQVKLDKLSAKGSVEANFSGQQPAIKAVLDVEKADLNPYLVQAVPARKGKNPAPSAPAGYWGTAPINVGFLKKFDAAISLHTKEVIIHALALDKSDIDITLSGGRLRINGKDIVLYSGSAELLLALDAASTPALSWNADITLNHINAGRLLTEVASFKQLDGIVDSKMILASQGKTSKEIVAALSGQGTLTLRNGAIKGMNLSLPPEKVTSLFKAVKNMEEETAFESATASFAIKNGIVSNNDLVLHTLLTDINGKGMVDLPNYLIHYRLVPVQAGKFLGGKKVSVLVEGDIRNPQMTVDISQLIPQNPKEALETMKGLKKNKKIKEEINRLRDIFDNIH